MVNRHPAIHRAAFTLVELLAVIVIISIAAALTLSAYRSIASDARISMASNALSSTLDHARAMAIQKRRNVLVAIRPVFASNETQHVEMTIAVETGEMHVNDHASWAWPHPSDEPTLGIKFTPVDGIKAQVLPEGIMVAAPVYSINTRDSGAISNDTWLSLSYLPNMQVDTINTKPEAPGVILGIIFDKTGVVRTAFSETGSQLAYVDFDNDGGMRCHNPASDETRVYCLLDPDRHDHDFCSGSGPLVEGVPEPGTIQPPPDINDFQCDFGLLDYSNDPPDLLHEVLLNYSHSIPSEEPYLLIATTLAIYDYQKARELYPADDPEHDWSWDPLDPNSPGPQRRRADLDEYVESHGIVFSFNRYTGITNK